MAIPQLVEPTWSLDERCAVADRWGIALEVVDRLTAMAALLEFPLQIISGARDRDHQESISSTPFDVSTHADEDQDGCPRLATGVDLWPQIAVTDVVRVRFGAEATRVGFRWGGGSPVDPQTGIPVDWNHLDLGSRVTSSR